MLHSLRKASPYLVTALAAALVYLNSFPGAFIQDDHLIVAWNPLLEHFDLIELLCSDYWGIGFNSGLYRPLTIASLYVNRLLLGPQPLGFHMVNVLLHVTVALLLLRLLQRWGLSAGSACFGALLFAVHPIHTEVVNEVVGRSELLAAAFVLIAFLCAAGTRLAADFATVVAFLLALLAKEHAIVFVALLPIVDAFQARGVRALQKRWPLYATLVAVAVCWLVWREWGVVRSGARDMYDPLHVPLAYYPGLERLLTAVKLQALYLAKLLFPWPLQAFYSGPDFPGRVTLGSLAGVTVLAGIAVAATVLVYGWRRCSMLALFGLLYLVSFLPTSNLFFPVGVTFAERLAYLPSLWFCGGIACLLGSVPGQEGRRRIVAAGLLGYALILGSLCMLRNRDFSSEIHLWQADVTRSPQNFVAWLALAESLTGEGRYPEAEQAFKRSLEIAPDSVPGLRAWAIFQLKNQRYAEAYAAAKHAVELQRANGDPRAAINIALLVEASVEMGDFPRALDWLQQGARFDDEEVSRPALLGRALAGVGRCEEALTEFGKIPGWRIDHTMALSFGQCLYRAGRLEQAGDLLEQALSRQDDASSWNLLGVVRAEQGRTLEAQVAFRQAIVRKPDNRHYQENLQRVLQMGSPGVGKEAP